MDPTLMFLILFVITAIGFTWTYLATRPRRGQHHRSHN